MKTVSELGLGEEPVVGETYLVPCMDISGVKYGPGLSYVFRDNIHKMKHVPVIGTVHSDPELPGAGGEKSHIHVDTRFMVAEHLEAWSVYDHSFAPSSYGPYIPIIPHIPEGYPEIHLHPMTCERVTPDHTNTLLAGEYYSALETDMEKHPLKLDKPICPHQGAPLGGIKPINGVIHCPLHGLGFCSKTGALVRKTKKLSEEGSVSPANWLTPSRINEEERQASCSP